VKAALAAVMIESIESEAFFDAINYCTFLLIFSTFAIKAVPLFPPPPKPPD
jgi:hypothetical protein